MRSLKVPDAGVLHAKLTASESTHACYGRMHRAGCPLSGASVSRADDGHWAQSCRAARLQVAGNCRCLSGITATYRISMRPRRLVFSAASGSDSAGQTALGKGWPMGAGTLGCGSYRGAVAGPSWPRAFSSPQISAFTACRPGVNGARRSTRRHQAPGACRPCLSVA